MSNSPRVHFHDQILGFGMQTYLEAPDQTMHAYILFQLEFYQRHYFTRSNLI
jgi:hypothetical protein